jgi:hypothetical protein
MSPSITAQDQKVIDGADINPDCPTPWTPGCRDARADGHWQEIVQSSDQRTNGAAHESQACIPSSSRTPVCLLFETQKAGIGGSHFCSNLRPAMAVPTYDGLFNPLLRAMRELGGSASVSEQEDKVAKLLNLSDQEASESTAGTERS